MNELDRMTAALRRSEPYFEDRGFTAAVMAALPAESELPLWIKNLILVAATAAGSGIAAWQLADLRPVALLSGVSLDYGTIGLAAFIVYAFTSTAVWVVRREMT